MKNSWFFPVVMVLALLSGCGQQAALPSPEYQQAREQWLVLLGAKLDKACLDPGVDNILALLRKVDPHSSDARLAAGLQREIENGRAEARARQEALNGRLLAAEAVARAGAASDQDSPVSRFLVPPAGPSEPAPGRPDAGSSVDQGPRPGMEAGELERKYSRCFEYKNPALVGGVAGGKVWGLKDLGVCRDLYKSFMGRSVLVMDGKVTAIRPNEELAPRPFQVVNGQLVPMADGATVSAPKSAATTPEESPAP